MENIQQFIREMMCDTSKNNYTNYDEKYYMFLEAYVGVSLGVFSIQVINQMVSRLMKSKYFTYNQISEEVFVKIKDLDESENEFTYN